MENFIVFNNLNLIEEKILAFYEINNDELFLDDSFYKDFFQSSACLDFHKIRQFLWPEVSDDNVDTIFNGR